MNYPDRVCRLYNELIPHVVDLNGMSSTLYDLKLLHDYDRFTLHFSIKEKYINNRMLYEAVLIVTDKLFDWLDLSSLGNSFQIRIHYLTNAKDIIFENYYDLMDKVYCWTIDAYTFGSQSDWVNKHPRKTQFIQYIEKKSFHYNMQELQKKIVWEPTTGLLKNDETTFFRKIKNKLVSLLHV